MKKLNISDSVNQIKGVGDKKSEKLAKLGILTVEDLINHLPVRYMDRRRVVPAMEAVPGRDVLVSGYLKRKNLRRIGYNRAITECVFQDDSGSFAVAFFNMPYMNKALNIGEHYAIFGRLNVFNGLRKFTNPEITVFESTADVRGLIPVYRCTSGITSKDLSKLNRQALDSIDELPEWIDEDIVTERRLCDPLYAYRNTHFPESEQHYKIARYRFIYEKLLMHQLAVKLRRKELETEALKSSLGDYASLNYSDFTGILSFALTDDQLSAIEDIRSDLAAERPMNRLIQGDVGSGKTAVAEAAIVMAAKGNYQSAFMAPTEILARQHYEKLESELGKLGLKVSLLTSKMKASARKAVLSDLVNGETDCIIGTHALIQDDVEFNNLGLVITDEQHRFGVNQRKMITSKGSAVNVIVMSATPIPRTLANTVYGDMDFSIIRQKPAARLPIITRAVSPDSRSRAYIAVKNELDKGHRAYVVAPSIDSTDSNMNSVNELYEKLKKEFKAYSVGLLHGQLSPSEKEAIMKDFADGRIELLVATVVVEVGIDVPDATIIVIENSERFGLSQLHQLRGRVGRSSLQSYCYLVNYSRNEIAAERTKLMTQIDDGFALSEEDYRLRGPGDIMGTMQHGAAGQDVFSLFRYAEILELATSDAEKIAANTGDYAMTLDKLASKLNNIDNSNVI